MKKFWRDYWETCKAFFGFMKKHWLGCIIFNIVACLVMFTIYCPMAYVTLWKSLTDKVKSIFKKNEKKMISLRRSPNKGSSLSRK